jgi:NitT/TauT family transport system permease protein
MADLGPTVEAMLASGAALARGRRHHRALRLRADLPVPWRVALGVLGLIALFFLWVWAAGAWNNLVPTPSATWSALRAGWQNGNLRKDFAISTQRIGIGYGISIGIGVVVGVLMASFSAIEAFAEAPIGFLRYIPATALTPLLILWLGIDETPKITLIVLGTVFFNILMVADVARAVPQELIKASYTLGAGRWTILRRVIVPHSLPGIVDVARINLAAAWLMLVVAELLAAQQGLAFRIVQAQRFQQVDTMFAMLIVFGLIGVASDLALRFLRNRFVWARA